MISSESLSSAFLSIGLILQAGSPHKVAKMASSSSLQLSNLAKPNGKNVSCPSTEINKKDVFANIDESNFSKVIGTERLRVKLEK